MTVIHEILLQKLEKYGIKGNSDKLFRSYLSNRFRFVCVNGIASNKQKVTRVVPQGLILGPTLFSSYVNDLSKFTEFSVRLKGGVEDARLEAKAKDTKKIRSQGQGQPFRGQTLSRPRTGMLEAKDRNARGQGQECSRPRPRTKDTFASVLKKKRSSKKLSGKLQFTGIARIFDWGGLNHKPHAMTSSKICLLALNQNFGKGRELKLIQLKSENT